MNVAELTEKYADRGLWFTPGGRGAMPVQAFGGIDGLRFYFRFRSDHATLKAGPFDNALEEACRLREAQVRVDRIERHQQKLLLNPNMDRTEFFFSAAAIGDRVDAPSQDEIWFMPSRVTAAQGISGVTGEQYAGDLTEQEFVDLFERLLLSLEDIPIDQQVNKSTINYLTDGGLWPLPA